MDPATKVFTIVFLVTTMLSIGLKVPLSDLLASLRDRRWMTRLLAVNFLLIPLLGLLLVAVFPMRRDAAVGLLLLAVAPGGLNAIQFTSKSTQGLSYAATMVFILSFLSVLVSPLLATAVIPMQTSLTVPYGKIAAWLLLGVLVPMFAGMTVHRFWGSIAHKLAKPFALVGTVSFVVVVVLMWGLRKQAQEGIRTYELVAVLTFIVATMVIGWALGGPGREMRRILATGSSMRNGALGILIAINSFPETSVDTAVTAFSAIMIPLNMVLTVYEVLQDRIARRRAGGDANASATKGAD